MSVPKGKSILQALAPYKVLGWFTKEFPRLVTSLISAFQYRNEVTGGGVVTAGGSVTASVMQIDTSALNCVLNGRIKAQLAAQNDLDLFTTSGAAARATYTSGATAAAISLATDQVAQVAIIACNSDGAGGAVDTDNGAVVLVAIVNGTASTFATKTAPPTSVEIQAALDAATGVHDGVTGWVWLASVVWDENSASPTETITLNRNNVISAL